MNHISTHPTYPPHAKSAGTSIVGPTGNRWRLDTLQEDEPEVLKHLKHAASEHLSQQMVDELRSGDFDYSIRLGLADALATANNFKKDCVAARAKELNDAVGEMQNVLPATEEGRAALDKCIASASVAAAALSEFRFPIKTGPDLWFATGERLGRTALVSLRNDSAQHRVIESLLQTAREDCDALQAHLGATEPARALAEACRESGAGMLEPHIDRAEDDLEVLNRFASDKAILQAMPGHFTSTRRDIAGLARELTGHHPAPVSSRDVLEFFQRPAIWIAMQRDLVEPGDHARFIVEVPASASDSELEGLWEQLGQLDLHVLPLVLRSDGSRRDGDVPGTVPVEAANAAAVGQARAWA